MKFINPSEDKHTTNSQTQKAIRPAISLLISKTEFNLAANEYPIIPATGVKLQHIIEALLTFLFFSLLNIPFFMKINIIIQYDITNRTYENIAIRIKINVL